MTCSEWLSRLGFDATRLRFTLRTALACCVAVLLAWLLGLEHPHWSGMTVWAASLPIRDHMVERSFFRIMGTVSGTLVGVLLVYVAGTQPFWLVTGMAIWLALCVGIGNLQRNFVSYGTMLAGYSAVMVAMLGIPHPDHILSLGVDRLLTALLGVVSALAIGWWFAGRQTQETVTQQLRRLTGKILNHMAQRVRGEPAQPNSVIEALLSEIAEIDEQLDLLGTGSLQSHRSIRPLRALLSAQVSALLWLQRGLTVAPNQAVALQLEQMATALAESSETQHVWLALEHTTSYPALDAVLLRMQAALADLGAGPDNGSEQGSEIQAAEIHLDWVGARQAMVRAGVTMFFVGLIWVFTGWRGGPYMMIGTAVMLSIFSAFDSPATIMGRVIFWGQLLGVIAALICRWVVWPFASSELELVLLMMPFIVLGGLVAAYRRTMACSYDFNMMMLILLQPAYPLTIPFSDSLIYGFAVILAPFSAYIAFRLIYPSTPQSRMKTLIGMMVQEVQDLAAKPSPIVRHPIRHARLYHRLVKLVRWIDKTGEKGMSALGGGLALQCLGTVTLSMQEMLQEPEIKDSTARRLQTVLNRVHNIRQEPERVISALELAAKRLASESRAEAELLHEAARLMSDNALFFENLKKT
ncbi:FUSC family protein [Paenalcaligenes niemegkensis]|uniref:FUSC family protein n=1 Tax=Paenalcaligenes niemegkensis TaxID=2895469 RepID=UPI001EE998D8|nr:FUSC family protein [Paenalcaligenes niemegkensis]MCQ9615842.1 FUSC family protein [Paenalcaligenes niemegkensis]